MESLAKYMIAFEQFCIMGALPAARYLAAYLASIDIEKTINNGDREIYPKIIANIYDRRIIANEIIKESFK